jgi:hypothetical protein
VKIRMFTSEILDRMTRRSLEALDQGLREEELLKFDFIKVEFSLIAAGTQLVPHGLRFKPTDAIVTRITGGGALTWNYDDFTDKLLSVTTTGPVNVRALIGASRENFE